MEAIVDAKAVQDEHGRRIDFYLKKKNLGHVKDNLLNAIAKLELQMEKDGVTYQDLQQQRASEEVIELAQQATKYQYIADAVFRRAITESAKTKEFDTLEQEFQGHRAVEQKTEEDTKAYAEAQERYKVNPSHENFARMIKAKGAYPEADINGNTLSEQEKMEATHEAMRQKIQVETAEKDTAEMSALEKMAKDKFDPTAAKIGKMKIAEKIRLKENQEDLVISEAEADRKFAEER